MVKTHVFEQSCVAAAKTFGKKHDINVVFRGTDAKTDGSTIQLPALDQTKELTERQVSIGRGYVDHEAGHIRHTERKIWVNAIKQAIDCGDTQLPALMNALEDVRIERLINDEYAGSKYNLQTTAKAVNDGYLKMYEKDNTIADDIAKVGAVAVTWEGRQRLGYDSNNDKCLDTVPKEIRDKVENWVDMVDGMRDTKDMVTCAISIANMIRKESGEQELPKEVVNAMISGEDLGGNASGSAKASGKDGKDAEEHSKDFKNHSGKHASSINASGMSKNPIDPTLDIQKELGIKDWKGHSVEYDTNVFTVQSKNSDKIHHATDKPNKYVNHYGDDETYGLTMAHGDGDSKYKKVFNMLGNTMGVMRRKLERALMSQQMRGWESGHEVGRLDSKRLVSAYQGIPNVYKIKEDVAELDTAVSVVVDHSGSMGGDKMRLAMQSCIALCESIYKCGCSLEIIGFATGSNYNEEDNKAVDRTYRREFGRTQPIDTYVYKSFDDRMNDSRRSLGNMLRVASNHGSCNADGCSVLVATERLLERQERRKVMIVLSDGYPQHHGHSTETSDKWLRNVVAYAVSKGIDIMGIGINSNAVKRFYPDYVVVRDIEELSKSVMDKLAKRLLGERFVIDNADLIKPNLRAVR